MRSKISQEELKEMFAPIIKAIDSAPVGEIIPSSWVAPEGYTLEKFEVEGVPVEHLIPKNKKTNKIVYQLHGGGYLYKLMDPYRNFAVKLSESAGGAEVFYTDYRLAPKDKFPSGLEDTVAVYKWMLSKGYDSKNIIFEGDSAGGNLALSTILYLKENKLPLPRLFIGVCPWADVEFKSKSRIINDDKDLAAGSKGMKCRVELKNPQYFEGMDVKNPYISPVYADYRGFPNMLLLSGSYEVLLDDAIKVKEKATKAGVRVKHKIYEGMSHDFVVSLPSLDESKDVWNEIKKFIRTEFKEK